MQVVIVSPLQRTLETAVGVFGGDVVSEGDILNADGEASNILMQSQDGQLNARSPRPSVRAPEGLPFIACELCRERVGMAPSWNHLLMASARCFMLPEP